MRINRPETTKAMQQAIRPYSHFGKITVTPSLVAAIAEAAERECEHLRAEVERLRDEHGDACPDCTDLPEDRH